MLCNATDHAVRVLLHLSVTCQKLSYAQSVQLAGTHIQTSPDFIDSIMVYIFILNMTLAMPHKAESSTLVQDRKMPSCLQANGMHPVAATQHSSLPIQTGTGMFPPSSASRATFRTHSSPDANGSSRSPGQVSTVQGSYQAGNVSHVSCVPVGIHMNSLANGGVPPSMPVSHASVSLESHGQPFDFYRSNALMQQASCVLAATHTAVHGLSKQRSIGTNGVYAPAAYATMPGSSGGVDIVDVTESQPHVSSQLESETDEGLPFPPSELPSFVAEA